LSPIDCEEVLKEIELYLDGELEDSMCGEIREHLSGCGPCTDRAEFRRRLRELFAEKCGCEQVPDRLRARVEALMQDPGQV